MVKILFELVKTTDLSTGAARVAATDKHQEKRCIYI